MHWLWIVVVLIPVGFLADMMAADGMMEGLEDLIREVFLGHVPEDTGIALSPAMRVETLCQPLTAEALARVRACREVRRAEVRAERVHWLKMYLDVADLVVRYDFEGVDNAGEVVRVKETAFLRVKYTTMRGRFCRSVTLNAAELWQPSPKEWERLLREGE